MCVPHILNLVCDCILGYEEITDIGTLSFGWIGSLHTTFKKKKSRSIKIGLFIESYEFQRPRGRYFFFFDTCSNLGHLLHYNIKNLARQFPRNSNHTYPNLLIFHGTFRDQF
jgi:hypothetical protein